jgi:hypothetical protein
MMGRGAARSSNDKRRKRQSVETERNGAGKRDLEISEDFLAARIQGGGGDLVVIGIFVEVSSVAGRAHFRHDGSRHGSSDQRLPVETLKPLVLADVGSAGLQVSEALGTVGLQEPATNSVSKLNRMTTEQNKCWQRRVWGCS